MLGNFAEEIIFFNNNNNKTQKINSYFGHVQLYLWISYNLE